jgi:integrase
VIKGGLAQRWADRPVREIDGHDVFGVIDETRRLGVPGLERRSEKPTEGQARAMLASLSTIFTWLGKRRIVERNPCVGVHRPAPSRPRDRVLDAAEMAKFWEAASAERTEVAVVLKLLLLTGARLNEAAGMQRSELSDDGTTWNLPGSRTKNRRPLTVPLPPMARDLIASVKSIAGATGFVFTTNGRVPIAGWSIVKARLEAAMKIAPGSLPCIRRRADHRVEGKPGIWERASRSDRTGTNGAAEGISRVGQAAVACEQTRAHRHHRAVGAAHRVAGAQEGRPAATQIRCLERGHRRTQRGLAGGERSGGVA